MKSKRKNLHKAMPQRVKLPDKRAKNNNRLIPAADGAAFPERNTLTAAGIFCDAENVRFHPFAA